jgi:hypothetical protein
MGSPWDGELGPGVPGIFVVKEEFGGAAGAVDVAVIHGESVDLADAGGEYVPSRGVEFGLVDA